MNKELLAVNLVIFGISGDLSKRYLLPALAVLDEMNHLPAGFKLLGLSRRNLAAAGVLEPATERLAKHLQMIEMDMSSLEDYKKLSHVLGERTQTIFYLSVPPAAVSQILKNLSAAGLNKGHTKLLLEKPFGYDLISARELIEQTKRCFYEEQIYRIDHYMAKAMAQNISVFLGSNALFRNVWSNEFIDSIDVVAAERIGIEGRADFYESTGALRDMLQNHLMNLAALTIMRPCSSAHEFEEMPERRLAALRKIKPAEPAKAVRGQYMGYRAEVGKKDTMTETFAAVTLESSDKRWAGVPIRLVTGKNLSEKMTEIRVNFKQTDQSQANSLVLRIQPHEGVEIDLWAKKPGYERDLQHLPLSFDYSEGADRLPDAYEQVLVDAMRSRASLFASSEEVLETWRILQPVLDSWENDEDLKLYDPGSSLEQILDE